MFENNISMRLGGEGQLSKMLISSLDLFRVFVIQMIRVKVYLLIEFSILFNGRHELDNTYYTRIINILSVCLSLGCLETIIYKAWEERTISEEQGRGIIHYYLASTSVSPLLALMGTEKCN